MRSCFHIELPVAGIAIDKNSADTFSCQLKRFCGSVRIFNRRLMDIFALYNLIQNLFKGFVAAPITLIQYVCFINLSGDIGMSTAISALGMAGAPQAMTGASMRMPPAQKMSNLFDRIDIGGSGSISKAQLDQAFSTLKPPSGFKSMGASAVFAKLDQNGTGSVSKQEFIGGMTQMMSQIRQQRLHNHESVAQAPAPAPKQTIDASLTSLNQMRIGSNINTTA